MTLRVGYHRNLYFFSYVPLGIVRRILKCQSPKKLSNAVYVHWPRKDPDPIENSQKGMSGYSERHCVEARRAKPKAPQA